MPAARKQRLVKGRRAATRCNPDGIADAIRLGENDGSVRVVTLAHVFLPQPTFCGELFFHKYFFLTMNLSNLPPAPLAFQQQGLLPIGLPQRRDRRVDRSPGMEGEGLRGPDQEAREGGRGAPRHQDR